jgi:hypothetical protein
LAEFLSAGNHTDRPHQFRTGSGYAKTKRTRSNADKNAAKSTKPIVKLAILERNGGALTVYDAAHLLDLGADRCSSGCGPAQGTDGIEHVAAAPRDDCPLVGINSHATHRGRRKRHRDRRGAHPVAACDGRRQ